MSARDKTRELLRRLWTSFRRRAVRYILVSEARVNWDLCVWNCSSPVRDDEPGRSRIRSLVARLTRGDERTEGEAEFFLDRRFRNETLKFEEERARRPRSRNVALETISTVRVATSS